MEREREEFANQLNKAYFPFTHGDQIERDRELLRQELKDEMRVVLTEKKRLSSTKESPRRDILPALNEDTTPKPPESRKDLL